MFKWGLLSPRYYILGAALMALPTFAQASAPSQEFWDYVEEYGDANGNVLDPLEYDQIINIKNNEKLALKEMPPANEQTSIDKAIDDTIDKRKVRNADMKFEQKSSAVSSSATTSTIKGAKL
jgi:hypothetical protein